MKDENRQYSCCFIGHRKLDVTFELTERLRNEIEYLITKEKIETFYFGSKSEFDDLCYDIVTGLKDKYPYIKRIYVRSVYPELSEEFEAYFLKHYEKSYCPYKLKGAGKSAYVERNQEMINKSDYCIFYYDENYLPPRRKQSKRSLTDYQPESGTKIACTYAIKKKKIIINVFN